MKLSFSLPSKAQSNLKKPSGSAVTAAVTNAEESREFVTEFDPSKVPTNFAKNQNVVIPPKSNEWRPTKKMKNLDLPHQSDGDHGVVQFEVDSASSVDVTSDSISYGLNLRNNTDDAVEPKIPNGDPLLDKLRQDLKRLPEDTRFDEYEDMPVEGFGRALLAGYGWVEGRGIGKNAKEDVAVVEYKRWTAKEGIGFTGELPPKSDRDNGWTNSHRKASESNGEKAVGEAKGEGKGFYVGKDVRIVGGSEVGMKGRILQMKRGGEVAVLRLLRSEEVVSVYVSDLADLGSVEEERCLRKLKELRIKEKSEVSDKRSVGDRDTRKDLTSSRRRDGGDKGMRDGKKESERGREETKGVDKFCWLTSHIRVRIISKELKGGRLYLKKGEIVDVVGPTTCDISMDENRELIQGVEQELLETALPRCGGPVLVLYGKDKGVYGSLLERDTENETGVVRDADTQELLKVRLEQIAEYIGDPSYIGY
ncbi:hypothetical protein ACH5RR_040885 [Cinchona calisaya]|uniref:G-patch domain-containing protein n=1 Tax=Cinchona calisaya TaxID=153742 RepID=A0ABD2XXD5_9GENT